MVSPPASSERIRECDCPPWVKQCVHIDGTVIILTSAEDIPAQVTKAHGAARGYRVVQSPSLTAHIKCKLCGLPHRRKGPGFAQSYDTHGAALAAFHEAEESLLRGDA